jgi:hypothetical protein
MKSKLRNQNYFGLMKIASELIELEFNKNLKRIGVEAIKFML